MPTSARWWDFAWICDVQESIRGEDPPPPPPPPSADPPPAPPPPTPDPPPPPPPSADPPPSSPPADPPPPTVDWRDRRIAQLTAQLRAAQAARPAEGIAGLTEAQINERVETRAREVAAQQQFDAKAADVQAAGRLAHPDFDGVVEQFKRVVNFQNPAEAQQYNNFLQAAFRLGPEGAVKVIHGLGSDLNEAAKILALSPVEMGVELGRRAAGSGGGDDISKTPRPPRPADRRGSTANTDETSPDDVERADKLSTAEWMRRRDAQVEAKRKAGVRMN